VRKLAKKLAVEKVLRAIKLLENASPKKINIRI